MGSGAGPQRRERSRDVPRLLPEDSTPELQASEEPQVWELPRLRAREGAAKSRQELPPGGQEPREEPVLLFPPSPRGWVPQAQPEPPVWEEAPAGAVPAWVVRSWAAPCAERVASEGRALRSRSSGEAPPRWSALVRAGEPRPRPRASLQTPRCTRCIGPARHPQVPWRDRPGKSWRSSGR